MNEALRYHRRIEDKFLAEEMAYTEKPYREMEKNAKRLIFPAQDREEVAKTLSTLAYYASENVALRMERGHQAEQFDLHGIKEIKSDHGYIVFAANTIASEVNAPYPHEFYARILDHFNPSENKLYGGKNIISPDIAKITVAEERKWIDRDPRDLRKGTDLIENPSSSTALRQRYGLLRRIAGATNYNNLASFSSPEQKISIFTADTNLGVLLHNAETSDQTYITAKRVVKKRSFPTEFTRKKLD